MDFAIIRSVTDITIKNAQNVLEVLGITTRGGFSLEAREML